MSEASDETAVTFAEEDVRNIIKEAIEETLKGVSYQHGQVPKWSNHIVEQTLKRLTILNKPFKYVVTSVIMQKNGAGLHTSSSCFWDKDTDGSTTFKWESKNLLCITSVFALAI